MDADFEEFVRQRTPSLLRVAYLLTGDQGHAEDLVQSALEKTGSAWSRIVRQDNPDAYVKQVMYRLQVSRWRRRRITEVLTDTTPEAPTGSGSDQVDLRLTVRAALLQVTPRQRAVLVLRFFEDRTEADTAAVLGCSVGTVKSQTHLALRRLRALVPDLQGVMSERTAAR